MFTPIGLSDTFASVQGVDRPGSQDRPRCAAWWHPLPAYGGSCQWPRYALAVPTISTGTMGWMRTSVGIALMVAPGAPMRFAGTESPTGAALLLMRTIGVRDLVLGLGTVSAARSNEESGARRWLRATLASDALDTIVSLAALRSIGRRDSLVAAALALGFVYGDLQALRAASEQRSSQHVT
jgi:hypothetical protein